MSNFATQNKMGELLALTLVLKPLKRNIENKIKQNGKV
jgi:hypothetical protein